MIDNWIDTVQDMWAGLVGDGFKNVWAPYLIKRAEFPSSIDASDLLTHPIALSIVGETQFKYSAGGPNEGFYNGVTEFHVAPSLDMALIPQIMQWPRLIAQAADGNLMLGGIVNVFVLQNRPDPITGPVELQYGDETPHWGFIVYWEVKENVNAYLSVGTGD